MLCICITVKFACLCVRTLKYLEHCIENFSTYFFRSYDQIIKRKKEGSLPSFLYLQITEWKASTGANFAGVISYTFGLLIWVTSLPPIRKRFFEVFYYTHQLYILFVIFFALHVGEYAFTKVVGGLFLFMLDRFLRFCQSRRNVRIISATSFPCGTVKLVISKPESKNITLQLSFSEAIVSN